MISWCQTGHDLNQWWLILLTHIWVTRFQWWVDYNDCDNFAADTCINTWRPEQNGHRLHDDVLKLNISVLLALCERNPPVTGRVPSQRLVTQSFDCFFDLCLNKRLSKQLRRKWFETPSGSLWRHCNVLTTFSSVSSQIVLCPIVYGSALRTGNALGPTKQHMIMWINDDFYPTMLRGVSHFIMVHLDKSISEDHTDQI